MKAFVDLNSFNNYIRFKKLFHLNYSVICYLVIKLLKYKIKHDLLY